MAPESTADPNLPLEERLAALFATLGVTGAHVAARSSTDWEGFAASHPERIASLTLVCPAAIDPATLQRFGSRLLVITGEHGPGSRRVQASLPDLPQAQRLVLSDYAGLTWSDLAAERGDEIGAAISDLVAARETLPPLHAPAEAEGEVAGISYRIRGAGPPLVLFPLELAPLQWEPLIPALAARFCTITLGGALLGSIGSLEERGRSGYMRVVRAVLDAVAIRPGEAVLEVGCGSGVVMRELARRTAGANRLTGRDMNPYFLGVARELARREGLDHLIEFGEGRAETLPLPDASVDVALACTVIEEGDADRMLAELVRVTRPGGRVGVIVRAIDLPCCVNLPLDAALRQKAEAPGAIGGGMSPGGCADASLYSRLHVLGLRQLDCFPQLVAVKPWQPRLARYQQQVLA
ncbi:MAG TPA: class I SAM-dependent methyltransferase, partial [Stellaceae bacterium]|nr:class I SAM-dependent methyltransferase [Stellaceae bacterium]